MDDSRMRLWLSEQHCNCKLTHLRELLCVGWQSDRCRGTKWREFYTKMEITNLLLPCVLTIWVQLLIMIIFWNWEHNCCVKTSDCEQNMCLEESLYTVVSASDWACCCKLSVLMSMAWSQAQAYLARPVGPARYASSWCRGDWQRTRTRQSAGATRPRSSGSPYQAPECPLLQ